MTTQLERRDAAVAWPEQDFEFRADGNGLEFKGYAAVFNSKSEDLGGFREVIAPGAFARSIGSSHARAIKAFLNHNQDIVLGNTKKGTLRLSEDNRGLLAEVTLPDSEWGRPVAEAVRRGDISSMSFGFNVPPKGDAWNDAHTERTLHEVHLWEVSPVTGWPAYAATTASVRTLVDAIDWTDEDSARGVLDGLTDEQRDILHRLLNRERAVPFIDPWMAARQASFAARMVEAKNRGVHVPDPEPQPGAQAEPAATT
jgi:HK97 family phage prohead protease